jgi:thiamine-monophosphate kinase
VSLGEFDLIARYFSRPPMRRDVQLGVGDDAALLEMPADRVLVAATDTLVEGRHFLPDAPARSVGHQALAVNLSDLAAMGAEPAWALLSLSLPVADEAWLEAFADGLYALADRFGVALVGGDTVHGPRVVTITALGLVERGQALRRDGARPGDLLYVSGWPGEAAAGLDALQRAAAQGREHPLALRHRYAEPRIALGRALRGKATAAMDVSDGLLGDLGKLCAASGVGACVEVDRLPISSPMSQEWGLSDCERFVLGGGDDYELMFTLPAADADRIESTLVPACAVHRIGRIEARPGVRCLRDGSVVSIEIPGYDHFA